MEKDSSPFWILDWRGGDANGDCGRVCIVAVCSYFISI